MPKRPPKVSAEQKRIRKGLAILKRKGLFKGDAKRATGDRRQKKLVAEYADVISGHAQVVKVTPLKDGKQHPSELRPRFGRIAVTKLKGETLRWDKAKEEIVGYRETNGRRVKRITFVHKISSLEDIPLPTKGRTFAYSVRFNHWTKSPRYEATGPEEAKKMLEALASFMMPYETKREISRRGSRKFIREDWLDAIEVEEIKGKSGRDESRLVA